jgi:hypothetical protein
MRSILGNASIAMRACGPSARGRMAGITPSSPKTRVVITAKTNSSKNPSPMSTPPRSCRNCGPW